MNYRTLLLPVCLLALGYVSASAKITLESPLDIPLILSGNFGELRTNHFHSGVDFKTQGRTGFKIHAVDSGYVSRIVVSPWGFGRAVYLTHPHSGLTTVYGHLESFSPRIDARVKAVQYEREQFAVDMEFGPEDLPVKRGQVIGLSGNAGSSGGPHLHMDVRETSTEHALDPLPYYRNRVKDTMAPRARRIVVYPRENGMVEGSVTAGAYRTPDKFTRPITAWGRVVPGINAYDRMDGTTNIYGVKYLSFYVDGREVYSRIVDRVDFGRTRAVHTLVDFRDRVASGQWMMITEIPRSNPLDWMVLADESRGVLTIDEERDYNCEFRMEDEHGNRSAVSFVIRGQRGEIPPAETATGNRVRFDRDFDYEDGGVKLHIPAGTLYDDINLTCISVADTALVSSRHEVGSEYVPLAGRYDLTIDLTSDIEPDKRKYCIVRIDGKKKSALSTRYDDGQVSASPSQFGSFGVMVDSVAPKITPFRKASWQKSGVVTYTISDKLSGIESYRGEIDGEFVLFELDGKTSRASYRLDSKRVKKGRKHKVTITVTDACGNSSKSVDTFTW